MSLIVLSNNSDEAKKQGGLDSGLYKPYEWRNYMNTPVTIPPHSEIAVHSIKINKNPMFNLSKASNKLFLWFGEILNDGSAVPDDKKLVTDTTSNPLLAWIGSNKRKQMNADDFALQIQRNINGTEVFSRKDPTNPSQTIQSTQGFLYHPNIMGLCKVAVKREAVTDLFKGFDISFDQRPRGTWGDEVFNHLPITKAEWTHKQGASTNFSVVEAGGGGALVRKLTGKVCVQGTNSPLSLTGGVCDYYVEDATGGFKCGLARSGEAGEFNCPPYFTDVGEDFYDFVVQTNVDDKDTIEVWHSVVDPDNPDNIKMREVVYYGWGGGGVPAGKLSFSGDKITDFRFQAFGESVTLAWSDDDKATWKPMVHTAKTYVAGGQTSANNFKPIGLPTWSLFPQISIDKASSYITLAQWSGIPAQNLSSAVTQYKEGIPNWSWRGMNKDWWATQQLLNREGKYAREIETRTCYNYEDVANEKDPKTLNASFGVDLNFVMILSQSELYKYTIGANSIEALGYEGTGVVSTPSAVVGTKVTFTSNQVPNISGVDDNSLFCKLNNFPFQSFNALKSSPSKILYHIPQFSNSGEEFGSLFFEANEKTYLSLNNPQALVMNEFECEIVHKDETPATECVGSSVMVIHVRKSRM
jgi:hypothetical protein